MRRGAFGFVRALRERRPAAVAGAVVLVVALVGAGVLVASRVSTSGPQAGSSEVAAESFTLEPTASATPAPTPTLEPTASATPSPSPTPVQFAATTNGVILPAGKAALATRHPIAVMIDDAGGARPQSGLSQADIVYQAPAEGGIPRYMAVFQTQDPPTIGPIRSARLYFIKWAQEWQAIYGHFGGQREALIYIKEIDSHGFWNADGKQGGGITWRTSRRVPHNVYSSADVLRAWGEKKGATTPLARSPWAFTDPAPLADRPAAFTISVPYPANRVVYRYDRATNTYPRSVTGETVQTDAGNGQPIAPSNVIVMFQKATREPPTIPGLRDHEEIASIGTGRAMVFTNGRAIEAQWSKASETAPTLLTWASSGQPVELVRGQIFIQSVPLDLKVTWG
jgi:hypothetical protein